MAGVLQFLIFAAMKKAFHSLLFLLLLLPAESIYAQTDSLLYHGWKAQNNPGIFLFSAGYRVPIYNQSILNSFFKNLRPEIMP